LPLPPRVPPRGPFRRWRCTWSIGDATSAGRRRRSRQKTTHQALENIPRHTTGPLRELSGGQSRDATTHTARDRTVIRDLRQLKCGSTAWVGDTFHATLSLRPTFPSHLSLRRPSDPRQKPVPTKVNAATLLCIWSLHCHFHQSLACIGLRCPVLSVLKDRCPIASLSHDRRPSPAAPPRCGWYPSPHHPPTHRRSFLFHVYPASLIMAIKASSSSVPDAGSGAVGSPPAIAGVRTGRRHRRRRQSPRGHCKRIRTECGRTAYPHLIHADAPKGGCGFLRIPVGRPTNYPHSMPTSQLPKVSIIPLYQSPFVYSR